MHVTNAFIEIELAELRKQYQEASNQLNALGGAIQFAEHLLKTMTGETVLPVVEPSEPAEVV